MTLNTYIVFNLPSTRCLTLYILELNRLSFVSVDFIEDNDFDIYIKLVLFLI